ncbi:MAG: rubredoxin [Clostridia bacterium]
MKKYVCSICGYVYDEQKEGVKFSDLPSSWVCPLCGAPKNAFVEQVATSASTSKQQPKEQAQQLNDKENAKLNDKELTNAELNVLCTNLAKGCEKQYRVEETTLFNEIANYYKLHSQQSNGNVDNLSSQLKFDLNAYATAFDVAKNDKDRGALRVLTWSEKVSKIADSIIARYKKEGTAFLQNTKIFVCEICGFIYLGDEAPDICPICKVPKFKIHEVGRI